MSTPAIYGRAHVAGISGTITYTTLGSNSVPLVTNLDSTHQWESTDLADPASGEVIGNLVTKEVLSGTIEFIAAGAASGANNTKAVAAGALKRPAINAVVTITDTTDTELAGAYTYTGGFQKTYLPGEAVKIRLNIRRYLSSDAATPAVLAAAAS
jgi:hypothetical protein